MATIRAYTNVEQSRKLAKFLPLESADMYYFRQIDNDYFPIDVESICPIPLFKDGKEDFNYDIPCWSLTALFILLPNEISTGERYCDKYQIDIRKYDGGDNTTFYQIAYGNNRGLSGSWHDMINTGEKEFAVDACYEMILKLHELKML